MHKRSDKSPVSGLNQELFTPSSFPPAERKRESEDETLYSHTFLYNQKMILISAKKERKIDRKKELLLTFREFSDEKFQLQLD